MHQLGQIIIKSLRVLMKGEGPHGVSLTNVQVLQTWQICPVELELACRHIKWVQYMLEHSEERDHVIALLWGHAEVDEEDRVLDESGRIT